MMLFKVVFLIAVAVSAFAVSVPAYSDLILVSIPVAVAAAWIIYRSAQGKRVETGRSQQTRTRRRAKEKAAAPHIVIDGSNVMHWNDGKPDIRKVRAAIEEARRAGFTPGVIFDANVGYLISNRYMDDAVIAEMLSLKKERVLVVPKGVVADEVILSSARDMQAPIISNDRYRDWEASFPEVRDHGKLVRGGYKGDKLWLAFSTNPESKAAS